ncbi:MAG: ribonuclease HII [Flavobacteriales bacterium]|nr:ribonuclease HII [Flavobacteriales bacterium]MCZ2443016.1 ribonuclease HII [Flavobacteriales bacterium]
MLLINSSGKEWEVGCDEAGRGCLAGPVVAAAVILPLDFAHPLLNDSKQMTEKNRFLLRDYIMVHAVAYATAFVSHEDIDRLNILRASILAMHKAIEALKIQPELIAVDGNRFTSYSTIPHQCFVKGDARFMHIAAASVLAKTARDEYMQAIHHEYPYYHWYENKGYPTMSHREAIRLFGYSPYHRLSFGRKDKQMLFDY